MNASFFLIDTLFGLYLMVVLLRLWLQWARADFYNPLSQFVVKATQPVLAPMRRMIPSVGSFDLATLVLALLIAFAKLALFKGMGLLRVDFSFLVVISLLTVLKEAGSMVFWVLIVRAILSWVSQGRSPIEYVLYQLTEPFLAPIRRVIPVIGGLDLSVLVAFIVLQLLNFLMGDIFGALWWQI